MEARRQFEAAVRPADAWADGALWRPLVALTADGSVAVYCIPGVLHWHGRSGEIDRVVRLDAQLHALSATDGDAVMGATADGRMLRISKSGTIEEFARGVSGVADLSCAFTRPWWIAACADTVERVGGPGEDSRPSWAVPVPEACTAVSVVSVSPAGDVPVPKRPRLSKDDLATFLYVLFPELKARQEGHDEFCLAVSRSGRLWGRWLFDDYGLAVVSPFVAVDAEALCVAAVASPACVVVISYVDCVPRIRMTLTLIAMTVVMEAPSC